MPTKKEWKNKLFGKENGITECMDMNEYNSMMYIDALAKGKEWIITALGENAYGVDCSTKEKAAMVFSQCGNGLDLYKKVHTLPDNMILVEK